MSASSVHAYVLAGGESRRMGRDKAHLPVDGEPLALRIARRFAGAVAGVSIVCKRGGGCEDLGLPVVYDAAPQRGLVHGMLAALAAAGPQWRLLLACDMPDVGPEVLDGLWRTAHATGARGAAPRLPGRDVPEPLPSLWNARLTPPALPATDLAAHRFVVGSGLALWHVPEEGRTWFAHANTPAELDAWQQSRRRDAGHADR
jgi:molybdopterin-guanine dinucleotide biosynthesis protein A